MIDYKKLIKNRRVRLTILKWLSFIPDKWMVSFQYRIKMGFWPNLKNPKRFTEKIQCYKLYYRDVAMKKCADKYDVREYIEFLGLGSILNECYGVFDNVEDIDFEKLPNTFVLKDTLGGGGNSVIVCTDKSTANLDEYRTIMKKWVKAHTGKSFGREWVYEGRKHRIIIEKYIESNAEQGGLIDYKLFCFNGKFRYMYVIADRVFGQKSGLAIYDRTFNRLSVRRCDENILKRNVTKPENLDGLIEVAEKISERFPEARVDLYYIGGKIIFGEITFFDGSGYMKYEPDSFDFELGAEFRLKDW